MDREASGIWAAIKTGFKTSIRFVREMVPTRRDQPFGEKRKPVWVRESAIRKVLRSSPFKVAIGFAFAVVVTTFTVFAFVSHEVASADIAQVRTVLQDEAAKAVNLPADQIKDELDLRLTHDLRRLDFVGLFDAKGSMTYGNATPNIPVPVDGKAHLINILEASSGDLEAAVFVAQKRGDGTILVLGRSLIEVYHLQSIIREVFVAAILPTVLITLLTGVIVSRAAAKRLTSIQDAIRMVMGGELHARLPSRGTSDDISELVEAVNLMLDEIVRLLNQIKSVGDNIAHDLRAPLTLMRARLERGLEAGTLENVTTASQDALDDLDRAMTTVTALLRISELEGGLQRKAFAPIDLTDICRDVFDLFEPLADAKSVTMTLDMPRSLALFGDGDLLREAVANLIDNAIKFTPPGGTINVQCDRDGALIRIADTGPGIPFEERDNVFKRFYRARTSTGTPGVGLGLSMAATIVALHGYVLRIDDNKPGAVFELVPATTPILTKKPDD